MVTLPIVVYPLIFPVGKYIVNSQQSFTKESDKKVSERKKTCFAGRGGCSENTSYAHLIHLGMDVFFTTFTTLLCMFHGHDFDFLCTIIFKRIGLQKHLQLSAKYKFACLNSVSKWLDDKL